MNLPKGIKVRDVILSRMILESVGLSGVSVAVDDDWLLLLVELVL